MGWESTYKQILQLFYIDREECKKLNLMQDWQTVKTKTSNINKLVEATKMVSCEFRFSLLS